MKNLPDRIYLDIRGFENVDLSFSEVRQRFGVPYYEHLMSTNDVEYVRKDAFIEKVCKFLDDRIKHDSIDYPMATVHLIDDFKNYMKGE